MISLQHGNLLFIQQTRHTSEILDVDNNCQIEILIFQIDGGGGIGGYFDPNIASQREIMFIDSGDLS